MRPCDNCIETECEVNGYICPLYKKYQDFCPNCGEERRMRMNNIEHTCGDESTLEMDVQFECCFKIKDLISMLLEFDMNKKATVYTTDKNSILIITDTSDEEAEND